MADSENIKKTEAERKAWLVAKMAAIAARSAAGVPVVIESQPGAVVASVQLPLWAEVVRGVPNSILRSALFGAIRRGPRAYLSRIKKATVDGVTIIHSGPTLDQADLDVWEQSLHLARTSGLGTRIQFSASGFLKSIGRSAGGKDIEWLKGAFARLTGSVVEIADGKRAYFGPLMQGGTRDDETGHYVITLTPEIVSLYDKDGWTAIEWEQRRTLKRQPLAQWLHGFYTSHAAAYPYKVETLHKLCGSQNKEIKGFKRELQQAMDMLASAMGWTCEIDDSDLVRVRKTPSDSQARHLAKRTLKRLK